MEALLFLSRELLPLMPLLLQEWCYMRSVLGLAIVLGVDVRNLCCGNLSELESNRSLDEVTGGFQTSRKASLNMP